MNSSIINILEILRVAKTLNSVGFSSGYHFDETCADEFFDELIADMSVMEPIFSGIIIIETSSEDEALTIVDGLQRITTLNLLLNALCEVAKNTSKRNEDSRNKIFTRYLVDENRVKLELSGAEYDIYRKIVFSESLTEDEIKSNLYQTYKRFLSKIKLQGLSPTKLFKVISQIQFMVVFVEKSEVSNRELYQSLNESKTDLSQINLITSFVTQCGEESSVAWRRTLHSFEKLELVPVLKQFIKDFLTVQSNGKVPEEKLLYKSFKTYFTKMSKYQSAEQIIENLRKYSQFYLKIVQADFEDLEIQSHIAMINENKGQDSYPYLMEVLDDLENSHIERAVFIDILSMINNFVASRSASSTPDMTMNFASLSSDLNKMIALKDYIPENVDESKLTINKINHLSTFEV